LLREALLAHQLLGEVTAAVALHQRVALPRDGADLPVVRHQPSPATRHTLRHSPRPWMRVTITSPSRSQRGGLRAMPTPAGVPGATTSPGSSVMIVDRYDTSSATPKSRSLVVLDCSTSPFTSHSMARSGPGDSSAVTSQGPSGVDRSHVLPWRNCVV